MLEIKLFGTGEARYASRPLIGFPTYQPYLLLCYLLLNRDYAQNRERLAAVFWGDHPTCVSRKYLRNAIWRLRCAFQSAGVPTDEYLFIGDNTISFLRSSQYNLDIENFEATVTRHQDQPGQGLNPEQVNQLTQAVELYTDDLLEDIDAEWCLYDRERLGLLYLNTLSKLLVFHSSHGSCERGLAYAERILARDPTREKVHREMMRLYWLTGEPNMALAQYKRCVQILHEELDVSPMRETQLMYQQMLRNQFCPDDRQPHGLDLSRGGSPSDDPTQSLAEHILRKVHHLQAVAEETGTELHHIETLLGRAFPDAT